MDTESKTILGKVSPLQVEGIVNYLLRELEFQIDLETKARDRTENMVQYLLTTVAAVIGAALLVINDRLNIFVVLFLASLLISLFAASTFYRFCRLLYVISYAKINRYQIRQRLIDLGLTEASLAIKFEGKPSAYSIRMVLGMCALGFICSTLNALTGLFFLMVSGLVVVEPGGLSFAPFTKFALIMVFTITLLFLMWILINYKGRVENRQRDIIGIGIQEALTDFDL
jgi:hypothetical protein